jgi:octaprenyl-diphosphate synthase
MIDYPLSSVVMLLSTQTNTSAGVSEYRVPAFQIINSHLDRVRELINEQLTTPVRRPSHESRATSDELFEYMRSHNGKMIRPGLVLLAGACFGDITEEHLRVAAMVEMVHDATLLHDDVIDNGQKRRAKPTVNSIWGNESAVLLGDFLLSRVFMLGAELKPKAAKIIAAAAVRLCEGELRQIKQKRNWQLSESKYIDIITEKSAVLFSSCCQLGATLAGAEDAQVSLLADFGLNAGIAFQITDDLLDILGDENQTGKTAGGDLNDNKLTLPVIHLLKTSGREKKKQIKSLIEGIKSAEEKKVLVEILHLSGSIDYARKRAAEFTASAVRALSGISQSPAKSALLETAEFMTSRTI